MLLLIEYDIQMIKQAQRRTTTETTAFILVFCYNDQFSFHLKTRFVCETKTGHYSESLIMKAMVSVAARRCAFLSYGYNIQ